MAAPINPATRERYLAALSDWHGEVGVRFNKRSRDYVLGELGLTTTRVGELLHEYVKMTAGTPHEVRETREGYRGRYDFHYDLRLDIAGRRVYVETVLDEESRRQPPFIQVVNMKDEDSKT